MSALASWALVLLAAGAVYVFMFAVYANADHAREDGEA